MNLSLFEIHVTRHYLFRLEGGAIMLRERERKLQRVAGVFYLYGFWLCIEKLT